jgi:hypothetical protein
MVLRVESGTGHVVARGRHGVLREEAFAYAFLLSQNLPHPFSGRRRPPDAGVEVIRLRGHPVAWVLEVGSESW